MTENVYNWMVKDVAKHYGYHPQYVRDLARFGNIPCIKRGRAWLFSEKELYDFFKNSRMEKIKKLEESEDFKE